MIAAIYARIHKAVTMCMRRTGRWREASATAHCEN